MLTRENMLNGTFVRVHEALLPANMLWAFRQNITLMTSEEDQQEVYFLRCKICQKEFPRFDQRGFRNAGFTAHQNRCIERKYLLNNPAHEHQSSPRQRFILPAPPPGSSSSSSSSIQKVAIARSNSTSPAAHQQQHQQQHAFPQQPIMDNTLSASGTQPIEIHYLPEDNTNSLIVQQQPQEANDNTYNDQQQQQYQINLSLYDGLNYFIPAISNNIILNEMPHEMPHEMIFPVIRCNYCHSEYGLHQPNCLYLDAFLRQSGSM